MFSRMMLVIISTLLITGCSTEEKPMNKEKKVNAEVKLEDLSPLERISKICLENDSDRCSQVTKVEGSSLTGLERGIFENYSWIDAIFTIQGSIGSKNILLDEKMGYLRNKDYKILIEKSNKNGNKYYTKFLTEKVEPLVMVWKSGKFKIGMNKTELLLSVGFPSDINKTTTANSISEQWVYRDLNTYVYLENGIVTSFQN